MTVIIGVAVKPKEQDKPFVLIGADSKKVDLMSVENGVPVYEINEESEKIYKLGGKIFAMAGQFPPALKDDLQCILTENDSDLEILCSLMVERIKNFFTIAEKERSGVDYYRATAILGSCDNGVPRIAKMEVDTRDMDKGGFRLFEQRVSGYTPLFIGATLNVQDLQMEFVKDVNQKNPNYNKLILGNRMTEYIKKAAVRNPKTCNQKVTFKDLY